MGVSSGAIRAGAAYVELLAPNDRLKADLAAAQTQVSQFYRKAQAASKNIARIEKLPGAAGQAANLAVLRSQQRAALERAGTLSQQIEGRQALASRLAAFKAGRGEADSMTSLALAAGQYGKAGVGAHAAVAAGARTAAVAQGNLNKSFAYGVKMMFSMKGLFRAGIAGAAVYALVHVLDGVADAIKEINELSAQGPLGDGQKAALMAEGLIKAIPLMGDIYTGVGKLVGELDGTAEAFRKVQKEVENTRKGIEGLAKMRALGRTGSNQATDLIVGLHEALGQTTEAATLRAKHEAERLIRHAREQIAEIRKESREAGIGKNNPARQEAISQWEKVIKLAEKARDLKLLEVAYPPDKTLISDAENLLNELITATGQVGMSHGAAAIQELVNRGAPPDLIEKLYKAQAGLNAANKREADRKEWQSVLSAWKEEVKTPSEVRAENIAKARTALKAEWITPDMFQRLMAKWALPTTVRGTFNGAALAGLAGQGGGPAERTAKAAERTATWIEKLWREVVILGGGKFL